MNSATNVEYDNSSIYTNTYTTFSGCDIVCSFGSQVIGELQGNGKYAPYQRKR